MRKSNLEAAALVVVVVAVVVVTAQRIRTYCPEPVLRVYAHMYVYVASVHNAYICTHSMFCGDAYAGRVVCHHATCTCEFVLCENFNFAP